MKQQLTLPVVMTGTIVPNSNFLKVQDVAVRKQQYVEALRYFAALGPVFFIENSSYPLLDDPDFQIPGVRCFQFAAGLPEDFERGKGYQEFRMLDAFVASEHCPPRFFKLTGRRTVINFRYFQRKYQRSTFQYFDLWKNAHFADTSFFCCDKAFYQAHLSGLYTQADDAAGRFIEKVVYPVLHEQHTVRFHPVPARYEGVAGTSGNRLKAKPHLPSILRRRLRAWLGKRDLDQRILG